MKTTTASQDIDRTRTAGRGVLSITASKFYFIVAGYAVQLMLPRLLKTPEQFGLYATTIGAVSILNNVMIAATIQTVSKRVSEQASTAAFTYRQALKIQFIIGAGLGGVLLVGAPAIAGTVLLDPKLEPLFRIAAVVVFCYALYAATIGSLNGRQLFQRQAALDITFTTLRTAGIAGAAALGFGVTGAVCGFSSAALVVLITALIVTGIGEAGAGIAWKRWLAFMVPLWLYQLCLNLTLQVDLVVLKRTVTAMGIYAGQMPELAAETASRYAAYYKAAQTFAFVPYQLIQSVTFVVFPMVSQAVALGEIEQTRRYIRTAMRFSLLVLFAVAAPVSGAAAGVMRIAYPDVYLAGSGALCILALGMVFFAMFVIAATVLSSAGKPGISAAIAFAAVLIVVGANLGLVRAVGIGDRTLIAAATGTSLGTSFAFFAVAIVIYRRFGALIAPMNAVRIVVAAFVGFTTAYLIPHTNVFFALVALGVGGLTYLVTLAVTKELGADELVAIQRVLRPSRKNSAR
jgi:stage V sporulation protein B